MMLWRGTRRDKPSPRLDIAAARRSLFTLSVGAVAGYLAFRLGMPLPWMLGPMLVLTALASSGAKVGVPRWLGPVAVPVVGVLLGSRMTPEIATQAASWASTLVLVVPYVAASALVSMTFYRRVAGFDAVTAYYAAMPGGINDMTILGGAAGGDERRIALAHATRILCVIAFVGLFFGIVLGVRSTGGGGAWVSISSFAPRDALILIAAAVAGYPLARLVRLPAPMMFGPMLLSASVHLSGIVEVPPPSVIIIAAQIGLGSRIGCRFSGVPRRRIVTDIGFGAVASVLMLGVAVVFGYVAGQLAGLPTSQTFLAFAPGGLIEMSLMAMAMGQQPAYVSIAHIARIFIVVMGAPIVARLRRASPDSR